MSGTISAPHRLIGDLFALAYRGAPGYEAHLSPHATLALSGDTGDYWLNTAVIGEGSDAEATMRHSATVLRDRALPGWILHEEALTTRLAPIAREFGLEDGGTTPYMVYWPEHAPALPQPGGNLDTERVTNVTGLSEANRITAAAFGSPRDAIDRVWGPLLLETPGLEIFLGRHNGEAISIVMTVRHGRVVGIWTMGTLPEHQRRGVGRQLLASILRYHLELGAVAFYLVAFEAGKRLYEQSGFRTETEFRVWIASSTAPH